MLLRLWEFDDGGGGGRGGAVRPSPRWLATIWWWGRFLVIHMMMAHQFRRVMKQTMVWKSVMGARLLLAYCRRFFLRVSVWLYVWVISLKSKKTHTQKMRERERVRLFVLLFGIRVGGSSRWTYYTLNDCDGLWDQIQTRPFNLLYIPNAIYEIGLVRRKG